MSLAVGSIVYAWVRMGAIARISQSNISKNLPDIFRVPPSLTL